MGSPWFGVVTLLGRLTVEAGSPDALCPDLATTEQAISARLGAVETDGEAKWRLRYTNGHAPNAPSGDFVRVELFDPENALRLTRDLPMAGESCATMARAIALVIERFFREMVSHTPHPAPSPASDENEVAPAGEPSDARTGSEAGARERRELQAVVSVRGGIAFPPVLPTVGLGFATRVGSRLALASSASWVIVPRTEDLEGGGTAELRSGTARLTLGATFDLEGPRWAVGPALAYSAEWGTTKGLPESDVKYRSVFAAGAEAWLELPLGDAWALELSGGVDAPFRSIAGDFVVDGVEVLELPAVRAWFGVGIGPAWFR